MHTGLGVGTSIFPEKGIFAAVRNAFALLGLVSVIAGALYILNGLQQSSISRLTSFGQVRYVGNLLLDTSQEAEDQQRRNLASFLARRYRIAANAAEHMVGAAFEVSDKVSIDPLLLLAVIAVESRFNPIAESEFGAKGLMQVIPRLHPDKIEEEGAEKKVLDPKTNILLGARILKQYIRQSGSLEGGLQIYNGSYLDDSNQYAAKVIAEQERYRQAMRASRPLAQAKQSDAL